MKTEDGNKLIAKFMGVQQTERGEYIFDDLTCSEHSLRYNEGWNWLMPVVEKIEKLGVYIVKINLNSCFIHPIDDTTNYIGKCHSPISKLDAVYQAVIQFINHYNENNN